MVNVEMGKIVPIYSCAILNTEKNVIKIASRSKKYLNQRQESSLQPCNVLGREKVLLKFGREREEEEAGCDKWKNNQREIQKMKSIFFC